MEDYYIFTNCLCFHIFSDISVIMAITKIITSAFGLVVFYVYLLIVTVATGSVLLLKLIFNGRQYFAVKERPTPPSIMKDSRWGTHRFLRLPQQKIRLHYVEKGNKDNPLMLCLHGFPECWFSWRETLVEFSDKYWVVAVDMRGYGESDKPERVKDYDVHTLVEDIREFIQVLGKEKSILVAHDWGGALAWNLAAKYPELFERHINVNSPHPGVKKQLIKTSPDQIFRSWYMVFFQLRYIPELLLRSNDFRIFNNIFQRSENKMTPEEVEVYKYYYSQSKALSAPINYYRQNFFYQEKNLPKVSVNSLIIWGTDDHALSRKIPELTFQFCEQLQVQYLQNCGHNVMQEKPKEAHTYMRKFLETLK